ncbi:MAG TPA: hypothetical protein PKA41_17815, partial [Verrucomicrobiota bacterium]|nr:hypothetical protein [Verrucomicrobiota bacterium]
MNICTQSLRRLPLSGILAVAVAIACSTRADDNPMRRFKMPDVPLPAIPNRALNITNFGAIPDGKTLNTDAIARGISTLVETGGGRLV